MTPHRSGSTTTPGAKIADAVLHPSARLRSVQVRHALRTALGLLVMLLITAPLSSGDPLVSTVLLATFSILQSSWRDTLTKARNKMVGVSVGSLAVAVILLVAPSGLLAPIAGVCLCLGLWFISTRPAVGSGFMVMVSVGFNAVTRDLDPVDLLAQYVGLTAGRGGGQRGAGLRRRPGVPRSAAAPPDRVGDRRDRRRAARLLARVGHLAARPAGAAPRGRRSSRTSWCPTTTSSTTGSSTSSTGCAPACAT